MSFQFDAKAIEIDWLKKWAMYSPHAVAIRCADSSRAFTYRELFERSVALSRWLKKEFGVQSGDRVAVLALNEPETIFLFFALQRIGAVLVPVNFRFSAREVDHVLEDSTAKVFFWQEGYASVVEKLQNRPEAMLPFEEMAKKLFELEIPTESSMEGDFESTSMILYTSGTTGAPKGAMITNKMMFWNSVNTGLRLNITSADRTVIFHPMFHTSGWNVLTTPFFHHGASIVMLRKFDAGKVLELCEEHGVSILFGVPTMMDMMARTPQFERSKFQSMRYAIVGGEPMPVDLIRIWAEKGIPIRQGYGLTEFGPNVFSLNEEDAVRKIGSIGFPNFYIDVKVVDASGRELLKPNEIGELCLRGPSCTSGYWKNAKATEETIRDGWLHTGDLVRRDEEGYFYIVGRKKEMYISGGENVYPAEVEQFLRLHQNVRETAVIGIPDEKWGEVGKCFYSTEDGNPLDETSLREYCQSGLAKYKIPKVFVHLLDLPKGDSGKILKKALASFT